jgi:N-acyl-D-aspartate/D-glutamate deacylase
VAWLLQQDHLLLGVADSGAHVTQLCDACFATDLLGRWVRERGALSWEQAIHKLTGEPARLFGLAGRGTLAPGAHADVCVFDPTTVGPGPTRRVRDFPAQGERLTADAPTGVTHVVVNGVPIRVDGVQRTDLDTLPGTVLRG